MARGEPDWKRGVRLYAWDGSQLVPILVDDSGQLYAVIKGTDGAQLRTLKVDSEGQIISILKGASGNNVAVDSEGNLSTVIKGNSAGTLIPIAVDSDGNLIAVVKGDYAGTLRTIAVDDQGRMLANLAAQDLAQVVTRPGLGAREHAYMSNVTVPAGESVEIVDVEGSGYFYYLAACLYDPGADIILHFWLDGEDFFDFWEEFPEWGEIEVTPYRRIAFTNASGTTSHGVLVYFNPPIAFDWQLRIKVFNSSMNDQKCAYEIYYTTL